MNLVYAYSSVARRVLLSFGGFESGAGCQLSTSIKCNVETIVDKDLPVGLPR